jgi:hypothetical protein
VISAEKFVDKHLLFLKHCKILYSFTLPYDS